MAVGSQVLRLLCYMLNISHVEEPDSDKMYDPYIR